MKNLKTAAVIVLLAMNIISIIVSIDYYKSIFESFTSSSRYNSPWMGLQTMLFVLAELFELSLCFVFLFATAEVKDKAYKLLRFYFVIYFIFHLPLTIMTWIQFGGNWAPWQLWYTVGMKLVSLFCVIVFLAAKPERNIERIDISNYELVAYTSTGHRFVHYLLDVLFFLPIWLPWISFSSYGFYRSGGILGNLFLYAGYFLYIFLSEAIFRQTFGKIWTNSCVVSNGIDLSTGRVLLRTLCRYIPFDGLSFLWQGKWHDSVSSTAVVYVNTWEKVFEEGPEGDNMVQNPV